MIIQVMMLRIYFLLIFRFCQSSDADPGPFPTTEQTTEEVDKLGDTRRIIGGSPIFDTRPYMVYLRPATLNHVDHNWLCGGVIIDESYILTSAACIEDIEHFYIVTGTHRWVPASQTNACIQNGAMRAVWKCVPRSYRYDGTSFNNIRWMVNDIAVVMTEESISFTKRVKGCDFIPNKIDYNNYTSEWEMPGIKGFVAGWGSLDIYTDAADIISRTSINSPGLMEAETIIINKLTCKQRWLKRYHEIIDNYMICAKQIARSRVSQNCEDNHAACRQLVFSEEVGPRTRRLERDPEKLLMDSAAQVRRMQKARKIKSRRSEGRILPGYGGFCENDHGGPLVVGRGTSAIVVGIVSAFRVKNESKNCYGPFLYTSVYNNRHLIECALYKETAKHLCTTVLRDSSTVLEEEKFDWRNMPFRARAVYEEDDAPVLRSGNDAVTDTPSDTNVTAIVDVVSQDGARIEYEEGAGPVFRSETDDVPLSPSSRATITVNVSSRDWLGIWRWKMINQTVGP